MLPRVAEATQRREEPTTSELYQCTATEWYSLQYNELVRLETIW